MKDQISIGDKYGPAMDITDQAEARAYFEQCVEHNLACRRREGLPDDRAEAERIERMNLGYFAGYYSNEVRERVERLFNCEHPVFGAIAVKGAPDSKDALIAGLLAGIKARS